MMTEALGLSILVSATATVFIALFGIGLGYLFARRRFPGKDWIEAALTLPMILPPVVTGYYLVVLTGRHGLIGSLLYEWTGFTFIFSWQGASLAAFIVAYPIMMRFAKSAFLAVDRELEHVSFTLGKNSWQTFFRVTLPLAKNGLWGGVILSFARAIGEFGATLMIAGNIPGETQTMPLAIYDALVSSRDDLAVTLVLILTGMSIAIVAVSTKLTRGKMTL